MTICPRCGLKAEPADRFCKKCGRRFDVNDPDFARAERAPAYVPPSAAAWTGETASAGGGWASAGTREDWSTSGAPILGSSTPSAAASPATAIAHLFARMTTAANPEEAREYALDGHEVAIGRSPSCDLVLEGDQLVSRRHALMRYDGEQYRLVDLGSSNGTYVNDLEITEAHTLLDGDRISIGEYELTYSTGPASPSASMTGAHLRTLTPAPSPTPKTEPHLAALPPLNGPLAGPLNGGMNGGMNGAARAGELLMEPEPTNPTVPKSDLKTEPSASAAATTIAAMMEGTAVTAPPMPTATTRAESAAETAMTAAAPEPNQATTKASAVAKPATAREAPGDLAAIREQVTELIAAVEVLAARAGEAERLAEQRRAALTEVGERLSALIAEQQRLVPATDESEELMPLLRLARLTAENPRQLDYITQLAEHAGEILSALETRQARLNAPTTMLDALVALRTWIYRLG
ncbi:MAG TPA: FHA domain-containing protein [Ktedonobacterales bacterium]